MKKRPLYIVFLVILFSFTIFMYACTPKEYTLVKESEFLLGTLCEIQVLTTSPKKAESAIEDVFEHIRNIENTMSTSIENSEIYLLNREAGVNPVELSDSTLYVIEKGLNYFELTDGAFNIGIGALIDLWGIGKDWQRVPSSAEIEEAKAHIDLNHLDIQNNLAFIQDPRMSIDLGGIAKGYAVDESVKILKDKGFTKGFVNFGGDVYAIGTKADDTPWYIGVQDPEIGSTGVILRIGLDDTSIVSSGDYERYFIQDNVRYHHIIDPKTGYPSDNELISVTILSDYAIDGDVLSTATFVMGLDKGLALVESLENIEAIFVTKERVIYSTSGIRDKIELMTQDYTISPH